MPASVPPAPRRLAVALVLLAGAAAPAIAQAPRRAPRAPVADAPSAERVLADITWLADDRREGRLTGSPGADSAAAYVARRFASLKLRPIVPDDDAAARCAGRSALGPARPAEHGPAVAERAYPPCSGFLQRFQARSIAMAHAGQNAALPAQNVVALLEGSDPALRGQVVVVGAHYDHLGRSAQFATDPRAGDAIRNGADDNASGTAAVLELARLLAAHPPKRSVLFVAFSGEELGLLGSQYFVEHAPVPLDSVVAMLNFDMVGRLKEDKLLVYGVATATELPALVDSANVAGPKLKVKAIGDGFGPSDHASFYAKDIPVLHFFTDQHPDYHAATDDAALVNAPGEARVLQLALGVARALGDRPARLTFTRAPRTPQMAGPESAEGPRPYLGSVPDMSADDVQGLRLSGVSPDSPAEKAGLKAGDVVVEMDGKPVTDLYSYSGVLYAHKPGDTLRVVVLRGGERVTVSVTLGRRGQ